MSRSRSRVRYPPMPPGWAPLSTPTRRRRGRLAATAPREILIFGALSVLLARSHLFTGPPILLAVLFARGLLGILWKCREFGGWGEIGRALAVGVAIAALAVIAIGTTPTHKAAAKPKAKAVKVEAAQADYLEQARKIWADAYAQTLGRGATKPLDQPAPKARKGDR